MESAPSRQSSVKPESSSSSPTSSSKFHPYTTANHRVTKGRYITSTDPRGYVPVYEYPLNNQWIMMDVDDGYVLWTGIWKALGNSKADIVKMVEAQPELASQLRRVRGGYLKIQGTWLPYEVALRLARRVAWSIRDDLVPLFGPTFPDTCLAPDQPGYGQVVPSSGRKSKRSKYQTQTQALSDSETHSRQASSASYHPYAPSSAGSADAPGLEQSPGAYQGGPYYQAMPSAVPGSHPQYASPQQPQYGGGYYAPSDDSGGLTRNPSVSSSGSRHRYAPYPPAPQAPVSSATPRQAQYPALLPPSPGSSTHSYPARHHHHSSSGTASPPPRDTRYDLPSLSTIDLPRPPQHHNNAFSLPPITSLREGDRPDMDASTVLRRLRLDDAPDANAAPRSSYEQPQQYQAVSVPYGSGQPSHYGDPAYAGSNRPYGQADPRSAWNQQQPQPVVGHAYPEQYHPSVAARGGAPRQW